MRTQVIENGLFFKAETSLEKLVIVRVLEESGRVQLWVELAPSCGCSQNEVVQYLTATEAMAFGKAFERCAIAALKNAN